MSSSTGHKQTAWWPPGSFMAHPGIIDGFAYRRGFSQKIRVRFQWGDLIGRLGDPGYAPLHPVFLLSRTINSRNIVVYPDANDCHVQVVCPNSETMLSGRGVTRNNITMHEIILRPALSAPITNM